MYTDVLTRQGDAQPKDLLSFKRDVENVAGRTEKNEVHSELEDLQEIGVELVYGTVRWCGACMRNYMRPMRFHTLARIIVCMK